MTSLAVATTVGGALLSASLQVLFDRLASREVLNFFKKRTSNVPDLLKKLKRKLNLLDGVLDDADVKQFTDQRVKDWSDDARGAVYEADDLLSEIAYEALRCEVEADHNYHQSQVKDLISSLSSTTTSFDKVIEPKLEGIILLLEDLIEEAKAFGLKSGVRPVKASNRSSSSLVVATDVKGRDSEKEELIKLLLSDETSSTSYEIGVIPVVGMGGMGKTTLAQLAYNDDTVDKQFKMKAWVCVSEEFDVLRVTKTIRKAIIECTGSSTDLNQVQDLNQAQESLKKELNGRKFLVVLDDVWNENYSHWDMLRTPFRTGASGSRIIVTTRIQNAASIMKTGPVINLAELSDGDSWSLFSQIAFSERDPSNYPVLEEIGKNIAKRCKGLPLAVKAIAGLLRSNLNVQDWDDMLKSEFWDLPEGTTGILPALRLSYHYLPSHLKQCFAFCSLFPKNYEFREEEIILLWIAQKFMLPQEGKNCEMEGKKCFRELLSMSFFKRSSSRESSFVMHDLIHDLACTISGKFSFMLDDKKPHDVPKKARHFAYRAGYRDNFAKLQVVKEVHGFRTFLPLHSLGDRFFNLSSEVLDDILSRQKHIRVLSLSPYLIREIPDKIGKLIHLDYLDLSRTWIQHLPESICRLYNLQTLLLSNCEFLTLLPVDVGNLVCLRRLDVEGTRLKEMPMQISRLKRLEYLSDFIVGECNGLGINVLKSLPRLGGTLRISGLQNIGDVKDASEAELNKKEHLEELALVWDGVLDDSQHEREVLDNLQPHKNLKVFTIRSYGGTRFPDWLGDYSFCQIEDLLLEDCHNCTSLPPLGQLPSLKRLAIAKMMSITEVGPEFFGSGTRPFPSLVALRFEGMLEWVNWCLPRLGELSKLQELVIIDCPKLVGFLPDRNIQKIEIGGCDSLKATSPTFLSSSSSPVDAASARKSVLIVRSVSEGVKLDWPGMSNLVELDLWSVPSLEGSASELCSLTKLEKLTVGACDNLLAISDTGLPPKLRIFKVRSCGRLRSVLDGMLCHSICLLHTLGMDDCPLLVSFADNGLPSSLSDISIESCPKLEFLDIEICSDDERLILRNCVLTKLNSFPNLKSLSLRGCYDLPNECWNLYMSSSRGLRLGLANVTYIRLDGCKKLKWLPEGMHNNLLPSLRRMDLINCREMESLFENGLLPSSLDTLYIDNCEKLVSCSREWGLQKLPALRSLVAGENQVIESFPEEGLLPSTLTSLSIQDFPNLKTLNGRGIQRLTSLDDLNIWKCPQLQRLPEEGLPPSVSTLSISGCRLLVPRCQKDMGDDWGKIAHIPFIQLDGKLI